MRRSRGDAGAFHAADLPAEPLVVVHEVDRPTLVIGSRQPISAVDLRVAAALGVAVVPRRSGGSAVLLMPGEHVWVDVVVPAGHPVWSDDVAAPMRWLGDVWCDALGGLGVPGHVHHGPMLRGPWSDAVCFAGTGTGEVVGSGERAKLVGIAQRRTRAWLRLQTVCHLRWRPELVAALAAAPRPTTAEVAPLAGAMPAGTTADDVVRAVVGRLLAD